MSTSERDTVSGAGRNAAAVWRPLLPATLSSRIVEQIRGAIFEHKLNPGEFLGTEASLAERFRVSRTAARDAIRSLHALGLVTIRKGAGGGITIAEGDPDRLAEALAIQLLLLGVSVPNLLDAQFAIELLTVEVAAQKITDAELEQLRSIIAAAEQKIAEAGPFIDLIFDFHVALAKVSLNAALAIPLKAYMDALRPYYRQATTRERAARVVGRYRELLELMAKRDAIAAKAAIAKHQMLVRRSVFRDR